MPCRIVLLALLLAGCRGDPPPPQPEPVEADGLHNVFRVTDRLISGSAPDGDAGFRSLQALGVRTVVSVDGATPDVEAARRIGLRYVHLPVGYDGVPEARAAELAAAVRDLPGPVYLHCHHGKHRGPAAAACAARALDPRRTAADAVAFLRTAGTDPRYAGLFAAAARPPATPAPPGGAFPEVAAVPDLAKIMVQIDECWDRIKSAREPADAVLLREHYREAGRLPGRTPALLRLFAEAEAAAGDLEAKLRSGKDIDPVITANQSLCSKCHVFHRDAGRK